MFSKTKIVGVLMVAMAFTKLAVDILDGNGVHVMSHVDEIQTALSGAGLYFLRDAIKKLEG